MTNEEDNLPLSQLATMSKLLQRCNSDARPEDFIPLDENVCIENDAIDELTLEDQDSGNDSGKRLHRERCHR
ncbi:hypothetical protein QE152_g15367 [Popillia japonica]|uniref:Uncharacterized protein n=1 Tax=Popillia japonica TaxID=7064 RepID=A0AAW1L8H3_POPJA